jgi:hypothetical protein
VSSPAKSVNDSPAPRGGFKRKVDKLTGRLYKMQELVRTLETRCRIQEKMIARLLAQRAGR